MGELSNEIGHEGSNERYTSEVYVGECDFCLDEKWIFNEYFSEIPLIIALLLPLRTLGGAAQWDKS